MQNYCFFEIRMAITSIRLTEPMLAKNTSCEKRDTKFSQANYAKETPMYLTIFCHLFAPLPPRARSETFAVGIGWMNMFSIVVYSKPYNSLQFEKHLLICLNLALKNI